MCKDYVSKVSNMGGVDTADHQNSAYAHDHKSCYNHWRRVMDAKFAQMFTNSFLG
ncbi:unnamed protein product [Pylaiella littoralis]